ncbi:MAG: hypothetical protein AAB305_05970 [Candidatus Zixiibacteriota bacterium]
MEIRKDYLYILEDNIDGSSYTSLAFGLNQCDNHVIEYFLGDRFSFLKLPFISSDERSARCLEIHEGYRRETTIRIVDKEQFPRIRSLTVPNIKVSWSKAVRDTIRGYKVWQTVNG